MYDLKLTSGGDLEVNDMGDIAITKSVRQAVQIRLQWLLGEWRFNPSAGIPYLEEVLVKRPDTDRIKQIIRNAIMEVDGITDVQNLDVTIDNVRRTAKIAFDAFSDEENFRNEVEISV